ncbi:hypothetical protein Pyrfu_1521 [Pyrolobus fumarii 1A]|uniref:Uncharacterized protein n=2 Tax=Pyrolobus fumarii TaxID=54252 RepID=G0EHM5_PYRF1|nr:hypothetical protein Pyrfu_1521 [Pyrolobus fumarii 1A]
MVGKGSAVLALHIAIGSVEPECSSLPCTFCVGREWFKLDGLYPWRWEQAMAYKKKFRKYLEVLEKLRVKQLDVYRYKDKDVLRLFVRGRVVVVELPKHREDMSVEEFEKHIRAAIGGEQ